jgi:hypothetical protein
MSDAVGETAPEADGTGVSDSVGRISVETEGSGTSDALGDAAKEGEGTVDDPRAVTGRVDRATVWDRFAVDIARVRVRERVGVGGGVIVRWNVPEAVNPCVADLAGVGSYGLSSVHSKTLRPSGACPGRTSSESA